MLALSDIFPKQLGIFSPNFTRLLIVHIYARIQYFIQLPPTVTKLWYIKCDHPKNFSVDGGHRVGKSVRQFQGGGLTHTVELKRKNSR